MIKVRDGANVSHAITGLRVRDGSNTPRVIAGIRVRDGSNVSHIVYSPMTASVAPASVEGYVYSNAPVTCRTEQAEVTVTGGATPTYAWTRTDAAPGAWTIVAPGGQRTAFDAPALANGETRSAVFQCVVSDANGNTVNLSVTAYASNYGRDTGSS